ncbi:MAG: hypothetical protein PUD79_08330 [Prevotellaceae bacterium]|nr:hypothetical protein [Prevotellaceae bacterium]
MKEEKIKELLKRYMEADTTPAEEEQLRQYFNEEDYDVQFAQYAPFFIAMPVEGNALTEEECDEILSRCEVSQSFGFMLRGWLRYVAVWLIGIALGGGGVWLLRGGVSPTVPVDVQAKVLPVVDTLYRERVVMRSDTVYVVKYKSVVVPQPTVVETKGMQSDDYPLELPVMSTETMWNEAGNVADLVVR